MTLERCSKRRCPGTRPPDVRVLAGVEEEPVGGVGRRVYDRCTLRRLRIENLVLIREAELELAPGLNAITGETGAGKTILAQALGLLLGAKGDDSVRRSGRRGGVRRGRARSSRTSLRSSRSYDRRTRTRSSSPAASSATAARAPTPGGGPPRARTSLQRWSEWSRCRASSSSAASRGRRTSSRCSTVSAARSSWLVALRRAPRGATCLRRGADTRS